MLIWGQEKHKDVVYICREAMQGCDDTGREAMHGCDNTGREALQGCDEIGREALQGCTFTV